MRRVGGPLLLATVWLSPAALLGLGPQLLADGTRGLWAAVGLAGSAVVGVLLLVGPRSHHLRSAPSNLSDLILHRWHRWPGTAPARAPVALAEALASGLFLWAQLAAGRELANVFGWREWGSGLRLCVAAAVVALLVAQSGDVAVRFARLAGIVAALGLVVPLAAVLAVTTLWWPRVFAEVASRPRVTFREGTAWTTDGRPVRGAARPDATLVFSEEQRLTLFGHGDAQVLPWEGGRRDVSGEAELTVRPGDRLIVPDGLRIRFPVDRRIPGAPANGPDWIDPPGDHGGGQALAGLAATLLLGGLGLPAVHAALGGMAPLTPREARAGAGFVVLGVGFAILWALYAAWLTPEIYAGGVSGPEVYELPASVATLARGGGGLRIGALAGLAAGGWAAALLALRALPRPLGSGEHSRVATIAVAGTGVLLVLSTSTPPWPVLLAALALAASACTPGALFASWSKRATARAVGLGATVGLALFAGLSLAALALQTELGPRAAGSGIGWLVAWPAVLACPANALVVWLASGGPRDSERPAVAFGADVGNN